ncbi:hypothetical protein [Wenyingzhuangia aestuarii]|uniref:hypothetical protein n=1 Tax=Wenyingzhuangia aestuarii TaxID=1647582 RepID=UPI00143AE954|nr:hypothetical protein [Wenyingzhuangia aestuarii]NJB83688.1 hypothetical protein [Wenyingzhuangia aestuarii]
MRTKLLKTLAFIFGTFFSLQMSAQTTVNLSTDFWTVSEGSLTNSGNPAELSYNVTGNDGQPVLTNSQTYDGTLASNRYLTIVFTNNTSATSLRTNVGSTKLFETIEASLGTQQTKEFDLSAATEWNSTTAQFVIQPREAKNTLTGTTFQIHSIVLSSSPTLSSKNNKIEGASVVVNNGSVSVKGANLEAVYAVTGQIVENTNLSSGVYIVVISKNGITSSVKVVL